MHLSCVVVGVVAVVVDGVGAGFSSVSSCIESSTLLKFWGVRDLITHKTGPLISLGVRVPTFAVLKMF